MFKLMLPSILTSINLVAGMMAIVLTMADKYGWAILLVIIAALFDSMDGRVARTFNASSEFGKELDSLADLISFGVAPAILMYAIKLQFIGYGGALVISLFPLAGALRLARFNIQNIKGYFVGVPITLAGPVLAVLAGVSKIFPDTVAVLLVLILAVLMVSTFRVPKL